MSVIPAVLLNTLQEYSFVSFPLWRMSNRKDLVWVELTFHKNQQLESTRRGLKAGGSLHPLLVSGFASPLQLDYQLKDRRQLANQRHIWRGIRHHHPCRHYISNQSITLPRYKTTMTASPTIYRPAPTSSPDAPPKKPRTKSLTTTAKIPTQYFRISIESEYPLHEKFDLQDIYSVKYKAIIKANRL